MALTPMMQQYLDIKEQYSDCILFFRLGDFYEMFFSDAETASRELEITLTGRDCGLESRAPMCGVPFHSADNYVARLVAKGYKVAICEQVEDAALAKGLVRRDVIRVITPGTVTDSQSLDERRNNFLTCIFALSDRYGMASVDVTTGDFSVTDISWGNTASKLMDELARIRPSEIVANSGFFKQRQLTEGVSLRFPVYMTQLEDDVFSQDDCLSALNQQFGSFPAEDSPLQVMGAGGLLSYIHGTQKVDLAHIRTVQSYKVETFLMIDASSRRNLELTETMRDRQRKGSLLWVLDRTATAMGSRLLRRWIEQPLVRKDDIEDRLSAVGEFKDSYMVRMEIRELFKQVYDMERLVGKVALGNANARDLIALRASFSRMPVLKGLLQDVKSPRIQALDNLVDPLEDICSLLDQALVDEPPVSVREGGLIREGFHEEVDKLRHASRDGKTWLMDLEQREKERSGIRNLKVGFNKVFGYYIEITKSNIGHAPGDYIRKQTLANCERYITEELKTIEETLLGAEEKVVTLEYQLFTELKDAVAERISRIRATACAVAELDALAGLAEVADRETYVCPEITEDDTILVEDGRHPVVEKMLERGAFVPNRTQLDTENDRVAVITGPNMAGKSTYMRQVALIVLMAQLGSFVPASAAKIGIVDRIFTRVGASDDLASGQSTFMVEMAEVSHILKNASRKSLLILDEIGRGTSTYDGLSIAWSVIEYVADAARIGARTLFATHYHELTELEGKITGIKNYCIAVEEKGEDVIFLRKIIRGGADGSYGIEVAKLAGLPPSVVERARELLRELEAADISRTDVRVRRGGAKKSLDGQVDLLSVSAFNQGSRVREEVLRALSETDVTAMTPMDALNTLYQLQQKLKKE